MSYCSLNSLLRKILRVIEEKQVELNRMDANIGDGDHGRTMVNAFRNVLEQTRDFKYEDVAEGLIKIGRILAFSTGAAAGPLFGSAFMEAGKKVKGKEKLDLENWADALRGAVEGVMKRGKADVGDKTMLDTLHPAAEALVNSVQEGDSLEQGLTKALEMAKEGMESTKDLISKRGRSSRLGERTKGHIDPGAVSSYYILEVIIKNCLENEGMKFEE